MSPETGQGSFWDHLDALRSVIVKALAVWLLLSAVAFAFKTELFDIVLAPKGNGFITYRILTRLCTWPGTTPPGNFSVGLINTGLAQQFLVHMKTAMCAGVILTAPFALYLIFRFVSPGLYRNERRYASRLVSWGYAMFLFGVALSYFIIFPLTFRFLGTYQVSVDVVNMISLDSYMGTLIMMCLCMGVVCELPVLAWLGGKSGLLKHRYMSRYRKHAIVVILILAAVITPTSDVFTLLVVSLPIWLLYEGSILLVKSTQKDN